MTDVEILLEVMKKTRFAGTLSRKGADYGFIKIDNCVLDLFVHRALCDDVDWQLMVPGDRLTFGVRESMKYPGRLCASHVLREKTSPAK